MRDIVLWDDYTAKIEAIASVNIRAQVGGYLKSINFKEGENVKKGDLLFVIDPRPYEAALASAEAELAEAKARVELAKTNLERAKELYAADVVAKELLDTRNCEMLSSNAVLASAEAKVRNAKLNLEYTSIRAPMSGKISEGSSLIPLTAIPVSLIGTFGFMDLFGFSINNISLFGIALAIGIVVDNAIVIVENVERNMKLGMDVKKATKDTMDHVQNALIAITLVLSAFRPHGVCRGHQWAIL